MGWGMRLLCIDLNYYGDKWSDISYSLIYQSFNHENAELFKDSLGWFPHVFKKWKMDGIRGQPQKKVKFSFLMIFCAEVMWEMKLRGLKLPMFGP